MSTPLHINLLLHYHCCGLPWNVDHPHTGVHDSYTQGLVEAGLIYATPGEGSGWRTTVHGRRAVDLLCEQLSTDLSYS